MIDWMDTKTHWPDENEPVLGLFEGGNLWPVLYSMTTDGAVWYGHDSGCLNEKSHYDNFDEDWKPKMWVSLPELPKEFK